MRKKRKMDGDRAHELWKCLTLWGFIMVAGFVWYLAFWLL